MSVGNDFLYSQNLRRRQWRRLLGLGLVVVGVMLLAGSGSYFLYAQIARSGLAEMEVDQPRVGADLTGNGLVVAPETTEQPRVGAQGTPPSTDDAPEPTTPAQQPTAPSQQPTTEAGPASLYIPMSRFSTIYPGQGIHPKYWDAPYYSEAYKPAGWELVQDFEPAADADAKPVGSLSRATRVQIPAIGVDSNIRELRVVNLGTSDAWETPNQVVGHIPTTPNVGEAGRSYWFGHLESPIKGQGSVFINLPRIPDLLKKGEEVYVIFTNQSGAEYLYKVFNTTVVHENDLEIKNANDPVISLVACVPRLVYDHRLVVTAELVGIKQA